uniref:Uncharacterized protein n=1 Tax=Anguilla anguilla TaxID=7936 RepID=A0A0E9PDX6_ANGAN
MLGTTYQPISCKTAGPVYLRELMRFCSHQVLICLSF